LLIGLLIAAGISLLLPPEFFETFLGNGFLAMLVVLAVALPMYVCATASVPIAAALLAKGIDPGAVLVFLMAGPATNAATITVLSNVLGKKVFAVYLATIVGSAFLFGTVVNELLPREWFALPGGMAAHHHVHNAWWASLAAVVLIGLIMNGFYVRYFKKQVKTVAMENTITLKVAGMECKHCVGNVETNLINLAGIDKVVADLRTETVTVTGSNIDLAEVEKMVNSLGYKYGGVELSFNM
jgi:uncharacterized membrane protein YraQ (UPF0718 family)